MLPLIRSRVRWLEDPLVNLRDAETPGRDCFVSSYVGLSSGGSLPPLSVRCLRNSSELVTLSGWKVMVVKECFGKCSGGGDDGGAFAFVSCLFVFLCFFVVITYYSVCLSIFSFFCLPCV